MKTVYRLIRYIAVRLFVILMVLSLCVVVFYYAMNLSNINIVLKDGMAKRAQVIIMNESAAELNKFFQEPYLQLDQNLKNAMDGKSPYLYYNVRGIDHRIKLTYMWCWPWENTARVTFTEEIPGIDGRVRTEYSDAAKSLYGDGYQNPPKWQNGSYSGVMIRENGRWMISSISLKEVLINE